MFPVEILRSGSTVCICRRKESARGGAGFRIEPGHDFQNVLILSRFVGDRMKRFV